MALALPRHPFHPAALGWFHNLSEPNSVFFCRATQQALLRLLTNAAVLAPYNYPSLTNRQAWAVCDALLADDRIVFQNREPAGVERRWKECALRDTASPKRWMDAYLAAFALTGGYRFVTFDSAFSQFEGLDLMVLA